MLWLLMGLPSTVEIMAGDKQHLRYGKSYRVAYRLSYQSSRRPFDGVFETFPAPS